MPRAVPAEDGVSCIVAYWRDLQEEKHKNRPSALSLGPGRLGWLRKATAEKVLAVAGSGSKGGWNGGGFGMGGLEWGGRLERGR